MRRYASTCNFGEFLNHSLRDQFICGIRNSATRKKLLNEDRTFQDALKVAIADKVASKETLEVQNDAKPGDESVHSMGNSRNLLNQQNRKPSLPSVLNILETSVDFEMLFAVDVNAPAILLVFAKKVNNNRVEQRLDSDAVFFEEDLFTVYDVNSLFSSEISVPLQIENEQCCMQLDTGCALSLAPMAFCEKFYSHIPLTPTAVQLSTYTGEKVQPLGKINVTVTYTGTEYSLPLLVVPQGCGALFGRNWLRHIKLDWNKLPGIQSQVPCPARARCAEITDNNKTLEGLLSQYDELFEPQLGCYTGEPVVLNESTGAKFHKARPVPYVLQKRVENALLKMEKDGVIERVSSATSAVPIVTVGKKDGDEVRVCGDFSVTYNSCANVETYPMSKIEDMHSALRGCTVFSVLDLKQAYHQIPVAKDSQKYLTINTHMGLFAFKRLPNGIHSGPAIFQRIMDGLLADIPKAVSRLDDILIAGTDYQDHLNTLSQVLERLLKYGFKLNKAKCKFLQSLVVYLGHLIDSAGLHPTMDKLAAVRDAPPPKDTVACHFLD